VKELIYQKLSDHFQVDMKLMAGAGCYRYIERAVADPSALPYIAFYAKEPYPVNFVTKVGERSLNKHLPSEGRVNAALWPSLFCCDKIHYADHAEDPSEEMLCPICGKKGELAPILYVLDGCAPELVEQLETIVKKEPVGEGLEFTEQNVAFPNHATDALRYVVYDMERIREIPPQGRTFQNQIQLTMAALKERADMEREQMHGGHRRGLQVVSRPNPLGPRWRTPKNWVS
jgi:hypothetical protein